MKISSADFDYIRTLVHQHAAIVIDDDKSYMVESRVATLLRTEGIGTVERLVQNLRQQPVGVLRQRLIEAMTTNETSFFRDLQPFDFLREQVIPKLRAARSSQRKLTIWCGACSTGQEPFSIAMTIKENFPELAGWDVRIVATDICNEVLQRAWTGRFNQIEINRGLPTKMLFRYFQKDGNEWQIAREIRSMIEFHQLNLLDSLAPLPSLDIVFLRNVLIYFDVETKRRILGKVRRQMAVDGVLFLGGAETTVNLDDTFERFQSERCGCYRLRSMPVEP